MSENVGCVLQADSAQGLSVAGNTAVTVLSGGNVGIGTTAPGAALEVSGNIRASGMYGERHTETSESGTTSNVDTGYTLDDVGKFAQYLVTIVGNPNLGGSATYKDVITGYLTVNSGWNGSAPRSYIYWTAVADPDINLVGDLSVDAVFWDGSSESTNADNDDAGTQIRIRVGGFNASWVGGDLQVRMVRLM